MIKLNDQHISLQEKYNKLQMENSSKQMECDELRRKI